MRATANSGTVNRLVGTLPQCIKCGAEFRHFEGQPKYKMCLDCREVMADRARRPAGIDLSVWMSTREGYRLTRGFSLMSRSEDNQ